MNVGSRIVSLEEFGFDERVLCTFSETRSNGVG